MEWDGGVDGMGWRGRWNGMEGVDGMGWRG